MSMFAGLDVGGKRTAVWVVDEKGKIIWQGMVDTHPEMIAAALKRFQGKLAKVSLESGPFTPHLHRSLVAMGYPMVHGCAPRRRRDQEPAHQVGQGRCLGPGRDAADWLVHGRACEDDRQPPHQDLAWGARPTG